MLSIIKVFVGTEQLVCTFAAITAAHVNNMHIKFSQVRNRAMPPPPLPAWPPAPRANLPGPIMIGTLNRGKVHCLPSSALKRNGIQDHLYRSNGAISYVRACWRFPICSDRPLCVTPQRKLRRKKRITSPPPPPPPPRRWKIQFDHKHYRAKSLWRATYLVGFPRGAGGGGGGGVQGAAAMFICRTRPGFRCGFISGRAQDTASWRAGSLIGQVCGREDQERSESWEV
ncbi:unnamed protein product [Plutella xylostella]|uniref:(diamondback moth) hypothetical protein n=1 Tax=Plutella xylostella TaxID=51655 RepID=A0A8S4G424_PLUXY|nr:unnamed protein product [Plutella xylostella]